jgi:hypothetical protein
MQFRPCSHEESAKREKRTSSAKHDENFATANDKSSHPLSKRTHKTFPQLTFSVFSASLFHCKLERCIGNFLHKSSEEVKGGRKSSGFMVFIIFYFCIALRNDHRSFGFCGCTCDGVDDLGGARNRMTISSFTFNQYLNIKRRT